MIKKIFLIIFLFLLIPPLDAHAVTTSKKVTTTTITAPKGTEKTNFFNTTVEILSNSNLRVTEDIEVVSFGSQIKRGIFRDYPTEYVTDKGYIRTIDFKVLSVTRDGVADSYRLENISKGVRVYIGKSDYLLPNGTYRYNLVYEVTGLVGFFKDNDELYYNLIPSGWAFGIDNSTSKVIFPTLIDNSKIKSEAYSGFKDSTDQTNTDVTTYDKDGKTIVQVVLKKPLISLQGITILTHFPKGIVSQPAPSLNELAIKYDGQYFILILGFLLVIVISLLFYNKFGKEPIVRIPYPRFDIADDINPIHARSLIQEKFDFKGLTAEIVSLAIHGYLQIDKAEKGSAYTITKLKDGKESGISKFIDYLFPSFTSLEFKQKNHSKIEEMIGTVRYAIEEEFLKKTKYNNGFLKFVSIFLGLVVVFVASILPVRGFTTIPSLIFLYFFSLAIGAVFYKLYIYFNDTTKVIGAFRGVLNVLGVLILLASLSFCAFVSNGISNSSYLEIIILITLSLILGFIIPTLKNYTKEGLEKINYVKGLQMFVTATESERVKIMGKEYTKDMSTFNKFFPYAIAFDAESKWTNDFKDVIEKSMISNEVNGTYTSNNWIYFVGKSDNISSDLSSVGDNISSTLQTSSIDPTDYSSSSSSSGGHSFSSGGGGGGGSSGGGGGGGGGGGW
jgi:uncharacterized membrane protein YgcG